LVVSNEQVELAPEYHWYVYDPMPPEAAEFRVIVWPLSMVGAEGVTAPATRAPLTVTVTVVVAVPLSESVTLTQ
jgi:hypothetical protein